jgi:transcriptional regulator with GAF, ATPase, and Fis domain
LAQSPVLKLGADMLPVSSAENERLADLGSATGPQAAQSTLEDVEKRHILGVLERTSWVIEGERGAAKVLDLHPNTLRSRMKKLGIERSPSSSSSSPTKSRGHEASI